MGLLSVFGPAIISGIAEVAVEVLDSGNKRKVAIAQSDNQRKIENTKTIVGGAVIATGIAGLAYVASKAIDNSTSTKISTPFCSIETNKIPLINHEENPINVDQKTVWINGDTNEFGADVIDNQSNIVHKIVYQVRNIGDKVYQVYESKDGNQWMDIGIIDWNTMGSYDLGLPPNGGRVFGEIVKLAFRLLQKETTSV